MQPRPIRRLGCRPGCAVLAVVLVLLVGFGECQAQERPARENARVERERAARGLGDKDFAVREAATDFLWQCGLAAQPLLEQVAAGGDAAKP